jgi:hypothetical protein
MFKDTISEATRRDGVYGYDSGPVGERSFTFNRGKPGDLHPAEAQVRAAYAAQLEDNADVPGLERGIALAMQAKARAVRGAMPILDFKRALAVYNDSLDDGPSTGLNRIEYQTGVRQAQAKLVEDNPYPADFENAVDAALQRGQSPDDVDLYAVTGIPDPNAEKGTVRPLSKAQLNARIVKAVDERMTSLGFRMDAMRRELADFKAEQTRLGARF